MSGLEKAYIANLQDGDFPVQFTMNKPQESCDVYFHNGARVSGSELLKEKTMCKFSLDHSNASNAGPYEIVMNKESNPIMCSTDLLLTASKLHFYFSFFILHHYIGYNFIFIIYSTGNFAVTIAGVSDGNDGSTFVHCEVCGLYGSPTVLIKNGMQ